MLEITLTTVDGSFKVYMSQDKWNQLKAYEEEQYKLMSRWLYKEDGE